MKCREIKRKMLFDTPADLLAMPDIRDHIIGCVECEKMFAGERLTLLLIRARMKNGYGQELQGMSPYLMARIRNRIRELSDQGAGSWESAILALRGWLIAFGSAAIILLLLSIQWQITPRRALTRDHDTELSSISNVNEVLLSGNLARQAETDDDEVIGDGIDK